MSAILVGYNQAAALRRAIEALERSANREQLEILLVDCASADETASLDEHYPSLTVLRLPDHFGATKALNIATRTARGELLLYLSPDVEVAPDTIVRLRGEFRSRERLGRRVPASGESRRRAVYGEFDARCPRASYLRKFAARATIRPSLLCPISRRNRSRWLTRAATR